MIFLSPSYRRDLGRFLLLRDTIDRFYAGSSEHIVLVPRDDVAVFERRVSSPGVRVLCQNDFVVAVFYQKWLYKVLQTLMPGQEWRFQRWAGKPGWIVQQIVKLSAPAITDEETIVVLDSDVVFLKPFSDAAFLGRDGKLLVRLTPTHEAARQREHIARSRRALGVAEGPTESHYMSWPAILQRSWVKALQDHLEHTHGCSWQRSLYFAESLSEYSLYGVFVEEVLRPADLVVRERPFHLGVWVSESFKDEIARGVERVQDDDSLLCLLVQSNLNIEPNEYEEIIRQHLVPR